jgi:hypothetical protein
MAGAEELHYLTGKCPDKRKWTKIERREHPLGQTAEQDVGGCYGRKYMEHPQLPSLLYPTSPIFYLSPGW